MRGCTAARLRGEKKLHVSGYEREALDRWAARVEAWRDGGQRKDAVLAAPGLSPKARKRRAVLVYFDNDVKAAHPSSS